MGNRIWSGGSQNLCWRTVTEMYSSVTLLQYLLFCDLNIGLNMERRADSGAQCGQQCCVLANLIANILANLIANVLVNVIANVLFTFQIFFFLNTDFLLIPRAY
jgi:hypothetical protein